MRIVVWRKPEFSGDFVVAPNGTITHPLFRSVQVAGVPFATAEANLRRYLSQFEQNPEFVIEPLIRVAVSGEVGRPQVFALRPETTIAEAVVRAGGATQLGARDRVRVVRLDASGRQEQLIVNLTDPTAGYGKVPVKSGDQIIVDRRKSFMKDILLPTLGVIGSIASLGLLIDRVSRATTTRCPCALSPLTTACFPAASSLLSDPWSLVKAPGSVSFRQALNVVRRRFQLILAVTACGAALGMFLASREPTSYKASAMLRLAGERQTLTGVAEEVDPSLGRTADPMLSIIELLRSRTVAGVAVDSLGLQLVSLTPEFSVEDLTKVQVDPRAAGDSVQMVFRDDAVSARRGERALTVPYGQLVNLGVVQFVVRSRPAVEAVTLGIRSREAAIDAPPRGPAGHAQGADRRDRRRIRRRGSAHRPAHREQHCACVPDAERAVGPRTVPPEGRVPGGTAGPDRQHAGAGPGRAQLVPQPATARQLPGQACGGAVGPAGPRLPPGGARRRPAHVRHPAASG